MIYLSREDSHFFQAARLEFLIQDVYKRQEFMAAYYCGGLYIGSGLRCD